MAPDCPAAALRSCREQAKSLSLCRSKREHVILAVKRGVLALCSHPSTAFSGLFTLKRWTRMSLRSEPYPHGSKTNNGSGLVLVAKRGGKSRQEDLLCRPMWASLVAILDDSRVATHLCYTIRSGVRQKGALRPKLGKGSQVLG